VADILKYPLDPFKIQEACKYIQQKTKTYTDKDFPGTKLGQCPIEKKQTGRNNGYIEQCLPAVCSRWFRQTIEYGYQFSRKS
jgi:hypothetical protein